MYQATIPGLWTGRIDPADGDAGRRWHQLIEYVDLSKDVIPTLQAREKGCVILGFCSDEGVKRNQGRPGAAEGPKHIRKACFSLAAHFENPIRLIDGGDVVCVQGDLESAHLELQEYVAKILSKGYFPLVLGGGHEVAFGNYMGIVSHLQQTSDRPKIGIINFDAHFDLRVRQDGPSSGTPFLQIADWCGKNNTPFDYLCLGIQKSANTKALFAKANELGVKYIYGSELSLQNQFDLQRQIGNFMADKDAIYLTVCLDVFSAPFAPGVSAPAAMGVLPDIVFKLKEFIMTSGKVVGCDIAEMNPFYDIDNRTAKLAAAISYEIVEEMSKG
ncbi:formimidoylglutamase [Xanthovirga aplysinae]|uniref:formimidoylglutamase n=1 Tax=Xanthovirga aplysinae TaxID=2529853 RepID=UPI0012BCE315|nr:formimidoylglutamase [Xanthovirga aplysinae]MTI29479.1 formimidoylglutamase [Xanthovirga aplysinae]